MERIFSYGTLQQDTVQQETFGRLLEGERDELSGYILSEVKIQSKEVIARSGKELHPILVHTGKAEDVVSGTSFEITADELAQSDAYEVEEYVRVREVLQSGKPAWVYVSKD